MVVGPPPTIDVALTFPVSSDNSRYLGVPEVVSRMQDRTGRMKDGSPAMQDGSAK